MVAPLTGVRATLVRSVVNRSDYVLKRTVVISLPRHVDIVEVRVFESRIVHSVTVARIREDRGS